MRVPITKNCMKSKLKWKTDREPRAAGACASNAATGPAVRVAISTAFSSGSSTARPKAVNLQRLTAEAPVPRLSASRGSPRHVSSFSNDTRPTAEQAFTSRPRLAALHVDDRRARRDRRDADGACATSHRDGHTFPEMLPMPETSQLKPSHGCASLQALRESPSEPALPAPRRFRIVPSTSAVEPWGICEALMARGIRRRPGTPCFTQQHRDVSQKTPACASPTDP